MPQLKRPVFCVHRQLLDTLSRRYSFLHLDKEASECYTFDSSKSSCQGGKNSFQEGNDGHDHG